MHNFNHEDHFSIQSRLLTLTDVLSAGCDPDFDASQEELEREFAELRLHLSHQE